MCFFPWLVWKQEVPCFLSGGYFRSQSFMPYSHDSSCPLHEAGGAVMDFDVSMGEEVEIKGFVEGGQCGSLNFFLQLILYSVEMWGIDHFGEG